MRKTKIASALLVTSFFMLTACGQKGPLFIPADNTATPAASSSADKTDDKKTQTKAAE